MELDPFLFINMIHGCRFNIGTTSCEGRSKLKCYIDSMSHSLCGLLSICQTNSTISKYSRHWCSTAFSTFCPLLTYPFSIPYFCTQETMSNEHAMRFPFVGSAMLLSLFLLFKFLSKDLVNAVLTCYFFVLGIIALSYVLSHKFTAKFYRKFN